jgi:hypothetical protein
VISTGRQLTKFLSLLYTLQRATLTLAVRGQRGGVLSRAFAHGTLEAVTLVRLVLVPALRTLLTRRAVRYPVARTAVTYNKKQTS